jgi:hypothetical protein
MMHNKYSFFFKKRQELYHSLRKNITNKVTHETYEWCTIFDKAINSKCIYIESATEHKQDTYVLQNSLIKHALKAYV